MTAEAVEKWRKPRDWERREVVSRVNPKVVRLSATPTLNFCQVAESRKAALEQNRQRLGGTVSVLGDD
jgi:hypothetical protein